MKLPSPGIIKVDVARFALVTHAIPARRVRPFVPDRYELQTFEDAGGVERAFISATYFRNDGFRPVIGWPRLSFDEDTFRTYVSYEGRDCVYFLGRYLSSAVALGGQRALSRDVWQADIETAIEESARGYASFVVRSKGPKGVLQFSLRAEDEPTARPPFDSGWEHEQFLTFRPGGLFTSSVGAQGHMPVSHPRMSAREGRLVDGRFDLWTDLELLTPDEAAAPFSVLVTPGAPFTLHAPRPAR